MRTAESEPYHAPCAPRAVWAQTGLVRGGFLRAYAMAAFRHGCKTVIIPAANERDLEDIDQTVRGKLRFVIAKEIGTVLETALNP